MRDAYSAPGRKGPIDSEVVLGRFQDAGLLPPCCTHSEYRQLDLEEGERKFVLNYGLPLGRSQPTCEVKIPLHQVHILRRLQG